MSPRIQPPRSAIYRPPLVPNTVQQCQVSASVSQLETQHTSCWSGSRLSFRQRLRRIAREISAINVFSFHTCQITCQSSCRVLFRFRVPQLPWSRPLSSPLVTWKIRCSCLPGASKPFDLVADKTQRNQLHFRHSRAVLVPNPQTTFLECDS